MAQTVDDFETSLVPFARAPDTIPTSALDANDSTLDDVLKNAVKQGPSENLTDNTSSAKTAFRADGSLLDWHVLAIASLASKLTYDRFGRTIKPQNVVENIYCLTTVGHGASFTVKAHDANNFSSEDKLRLDDLGVSGIVFKRLRHQSSSTSDDANRLAAILFELRVLTHKPLHEHQNIVTFVGLLWEGDPLGRNLLWPILIMERAEYGSLSQFQQRRFTLRYETKRHLCADVAAGLDALHACGIVHGDVKNENILIFGHRERGFIAKVADFGCAVLDQHELDERTARLGGTPPWNAPEFRNSKLTRASMKATDVYSYGFVVWRTMIDGRDPFESFEFGNTGKLATIETWKEQDELIEKAIWSLMSQPESDVQAEEVCSIFEATLQTSPSRRDLKLVLQTFDREAALPPVGDDGPSTQSLQRIEAEMGQMLLDTYKLKDFDYLFQRQYVRALQYSLRLYQKNAQFSESAKCALLRCFLTGVGGEPSVDSALEVLMDICTNDDQVVLRHAEMILLSVRLCQAYGKPIPDHLPINHWLWCNAIFGSRHAHDVLSTRDPESAASALKISRTRIFGAGHEIQETIKQLLKEQTFLIDALDPASRFSDSFVFPETDNGDTPLHCAAMADELETVKALVNKTEVDVNVLNVLRESPLLQACRAGHFDVVCFLLSCGADPTIQSISHGESCLHFLSSFHEEWQMQYLTKECLERGADVEAFAAGPQGGMFSYEAPESGSPLHWAVGNANLAAVKALCNAGADIFKEYPNAKGLLRHPVHIAASRVYVDILRYFLHDCGVLKLSRSCTATYSKVDALLRDLTLGSLSDPISNKLLHGSKYTDSFAEAVSLLKEADVSFDKANAGELLFCVFRTGDLARLEVLLKNGCPIDATFGEEETLLQQCIVTCDRGMFDLALAYGADVMRQTSEGSYLHLCVTSYHHDAYFAEELLKRGVYVDGLNDTGCTPFRNAVKLGCFDLATVFLRYGADKETIRNGMTVLGDLAMAGSDYPVVSLKFLLEPPHEFGAASFIISSKLQASVLQIAVTKSEAGRDSNGDMPYLAYILERFPLPKHLNAAGTGMTALHLAVQSCFSESVQLLLEAGADPNILNCRHQTALDKAIDMAEKADPSLPDFPEEIYEAGDKAVALYVARRWRLIEVLLSFGAMRSEDLPTAGLGAAQLVKVELQPLLQDRGHMCYSDSLPTLKEWTKCLRPVIENHLQDIAVTSPSLDRSLDEFTEAICEAIRPYYLKIYIDRDPDELSLVFMIMGVNEAEEVEIELVQALSV